MIAARLPSYVLYAANKNDENVQMNRPTSMTANILIIFIVLVVVIVLFFVCIILMVRHDRKSAKEDILNAEVSQQKKYD